MPQFRTITPDKCYSDVAAAGTRTLCVTVPELVECGVSDNTVKYGLKCQRTGEVYCWPHHKEGNTIYIHYDGLKDRYKRMIDRLHCDGIEAELWTINRDSAARHTRLKALCGSLPSMVEVYPDDLAEIRASRCLNGMDAHRTARAAGWLRLWRRMDVKAARRMGFRSVTELQAALFEHCMDEQAAGIIRFPKPITAARVLDRKAREFAAKGVTTLVGGYFGNANRGKIDTLIHAVLIELASSPLKYSFEDIAMMYNTDPAYSHLERLSVSAIKQHLNNPAYKKIWYYARHGRDAGDNKYQVEALRQQITTPDQLWSIDGTASQLYYRDAEGRMKSDLYIYFVADAATGAIVGSSVAFAETSGLVTEALTDAVEKHGYCPEQLQYDNSSANVQCMVEGLMNNMTRVHFPCKPYRGKAKYIESIIGHFQQQVLRQHRNFKGGNVTVKSLNSKANPELLKWLKKNPAELPSQDEAIQQIYDAIEAWNTRGERRDSYGRWTGMSKIERYTAEAEGRRRLNYFDKLSLFRVELPKAYKYTQQGIKITIGGKKYYYVVPDTDDTTSDFIFSNENMYAEFKVRVNINDPQCIELFTKDGRPVATAVEKERFAAAVAQMEPGDKAAIRMFNDMQETYGYNYAMGELRRQRDILEQNSLRATGTGDYFGICYNEKQGEHLGWKDSAKFTTNAIENVEEDIANGLKPRETKQRSILTALKNF